MNTLFSLVPVTISISLTAILVFATGWILKTPLNKSSKYGVSQSFIRFIILLAGTIAIIITLPINESMKNSLLTLFGIIVSATITLSSTTFMGNAMAGILLRSMRHLSIGDYISVGDHFGRITEQGTFHTEIQLENRNLTTLPNLFLVTNPITATRSSGTIISSEVSLGYDLDHGNIETALIKAVEETGLKDPFVQIMELGDFSVTYRSAGLLEDSSHLLSTQASLKTNILNALHIAGIEIVSPTFMNQRVYPLEKQFIPKTSLSPRTADAKEGSGPRDEVIFDKVEVAVLAEALKDKLARLEQEQEKLAKDAKSAENEVEKQQLENQIEKNNVVIKVLEHKIRDAENDARN